MANKLKKGFTLIELLAVILILGVIAIIAIPTVNNIINEAKRNSFKATIQNVVKAIEDECQVQKLKGGAIATTYTFSDIGILPSLDIKGSLPTGGIVTVDNECNVTFRNVTDGEYKATKLTINDEFVIDEASHKICQVMQGDGTNIGDIITCGTESFYVYDATGDTIKMLAKYNLKVGGVYNNDPSIYKKYTVYTESEITNMQDETMKGCQDEQIFRYGTIAFSSDEKHGIKISSYDGSIVQDYVDRYAEILTNMGINLQETRLILRQELISLGCDGSNNTCLDAPSFVRETSYWLGTLAGSTIIHTLSYDGTMIGIYYKNNSDFGVRPVVVIPKSEI